MNEAFRGLKADSAFDINNYVHFRAPLSKEKIEMNARSEGIYNNEFLDCAAHDTPSGAWSVLKDTTGSVAVIRNKLWPGYMAYHKCSTRVFGGFYVGNGCKSLDMPFMF